MLAHASFMLKVVETEVRPIVHELCSFVSHKVCRTQLEAMWTDCRVPLGFEFPVVPIFICTEYSPVGIVTGYELDDREVEIRVPVGSRIFSTSSRPVLRPT
jgi:hypothetical protein